jgi:urea transport system permease protein
MPEVWLFALGGLFIFVTLFLPKGIVGLVTKGSRKWRQRGKSDGGFPVAAEPRGEAAQ